MGKGRSFVALGRRRINKSISSLDTAARPWKREFFTWFYAPFGQIWHPSEREITHPSVARCARCARITHPSVAFYAPFGGAQGKAALAPCSLLAPHTRSGCARRCDGVGMCVSQVSGIGGKQVIVREAMRCRQLLWSAASFLLGGLVH